MPAFQLIPTLLGLLPPGHWGAGGGLGIQAHGLGPQADRLWGEKGSNVVTHKAGLPPESPQGSPKLPSALGCWPQLAQSQPADAAIT